MLKTRSMISQRSGGIYGASPWAMAPGLGRTVGVGAVIGVVVFFVGGCAGMLAAGVGWGAAAGLGVFVAMWGGIGFGSMVGGVTYLVRSEAAEARAPATAAARPVEPSATVTGALPADVDLRAVGAGVPGGPVAGPPVDADGRAPIPLPAVEPAVR